MSLLLEALKKAERAKEEARRNSLDEPGSPESFSLSDPEPRHVMTRDELPDITRPVDIGTSDLESASATPAPPPAAQEPRVRATEPDESAEKRATARKVFEAKKFKEPNPRLPFYITIGFLGAFAVGTVVYFWLQLRPPAPLVNANPPKPAGEPATQAAAAPAPATAAPAPSPTAPALPGLPAKADTPATALPAVQGTASELVKPSPPAAAPPPSRNPVTDASPPKAAPAARSAPAAAATPRTPRSSGSQRSAPSPDAAQGNLALGRGQPSVDPRLEAAYTDVQAGRLDAARAQYGQILREDPNQRDALLGLAAVESRAGRIDAADTLYQRLLRLDPRDAHAHAGLLALRGEQIDPVLAESRLKSLLANDPEASVLQASLGDQYARQLRWTEAQQAYFKAFASEPENPDYAYNLAVSLDHLRQPRLAAEYYRRALSLAEKRDARFDKEQARRRADALPR